MWLYRDLSIQFSDYQLKRRRLAIGHFGIERSQGTFERFGNGHVMFQTSCWGNSQITSESVNVERSILCYNNGLKMPKMMMGNRIEYSKYEIYKLETLSIGGPRGTPINRLYTYVGHQIIWFLTPLV